jgi:glyoxylase-like metal-dependent hydrolase (beta-lactamase superfamily II)
MTTVEQTTAQLPTSAHFRLEQLADGVYAALSVPGRGALCNAGIVDLGDETLIFDTMFTLQAARDLRDAAEQLTGRPARYVINSHLHADHINGNQVFFEDGRRPSLIATEKTRELMGPRHAEFFTEIHESGASSLEEMRQQLENETDEQQRAALERQIGEQEELLQTMPALRTVLPDLAFDHTLLFHGTQRTAEVVTLGGGHTPSDAVLLLRDERILFIGDLVFAGLHTMLLDGDPAELRRMLSEIETWDVARVVPGHGRLGTLDDCRQVRQYASDVEALVREAIARGATAEEAMQTPVPAIYADLGGREVFSWNMGELLKKWTENKQEAEK